MFFRKNARQLWPATALALLALLLVGEGVRWTVGLFTDNETIVSVVASIVLALLAGLMVTTHNATLQELLSDCKHERDKLKDKLDGADALQQRLADDRDNALRSCGYHQRRAEEILAQLRALQGGYHPSDVGANNVPEDWQTSDRIPPPRGPVVTAAPSDRPDDELERL